MAETSKELLSNIAPFGLRMQAELKERVRDAAERNNRSLNAEIVARLEGSLDRDENGNIILPLPEKLMDRIGRQARHDDMDVLALITDALESAFPPPKLSLGRIIQEIQAALLSGKAKDEKTRRELEEYLRGAEALIKAEPDFEHLTVDVERIQTHERP